MKRTPNIKNICLGMAVVVLVFLVICKLTAPIEDKDADFEKKFCGTWYTANSFINERIEICKNGIAYWTDLKSANPREVRCTYHRDGFDIVFQPEGQSQFKRFTSEGYLLAPGPGHSLNIVYCKAPASH